MDFNNQNDFGDPIQTNYYQKIQDQQYNEADLIKETKINKDLLKKISDMKKMKIAKS